MSNKNNHAIATLIFSLCLGSTAVRAQEVNCDDWLSEDEKVLLNFWGSNAAETISNCLLTDDFAKTRDREGSTPLHHAAYYSDNPEVLTALLGSGMNVNTRNLGGSTALHWATTNVTNSLVALTILIDADADIEAKNEVGSTPLHDAVKYNDNENIVAFLLDVDADFEARVEDEQTVLHLAAKYNENPEIITYLLDAGADGSAVDEFGRTPFEYAQNNEALQGTDAYWALNDARFE